MNPLFDKLWLRGYSETNRKNIVSLIEEDKSCKFVDLGCDDGNLTLDIAEKINTNLIFGLEKNPGAASFPSLKSYHSSSWHSSLYLPMATFVGRSDGGT